MELDDLEQIVVPQPHGLPTLLFEKVLSVGGGIPLPSTLGGWSVLVVLWTLVALALLWRFHFRSLVFVWFMHNIYAPAESLRFEPRKRKLFAKLEELKAKRGDGRLVIIDIGSANGVNFQYYPTGTEVICVDPNPHWEPVVRAGNATWPVGLRVTEYHATFCEKMHEVIRAGVADAVIVGSIFCVVEDVDLCLSEIHRVLKTGGKLFYMEHVLSPSQYPLIRFLQHLLSPLYGFIFHGCHINRSFKDIVRRAKFSSVDGEAFEAFETLEPTPVFILSRLIRSRYWSTATK
jgi:SAM-dependent methyltransferase